MEIKDLKYYEKIVTEALENAGVSRSVFQIRVKMMASALRSLDLANEDLANLSSTLIASSQGDRAHPAFTIRKEAEDSLLKQLKALGLSQDDLTGAEAEASKIADLYEAMRDVGPKKKSKKK